MKTTPALAEGNDFVFYGLYQSLPVGAAFLLRETICRAVFEGRHAAGAERKSPPAKAETRPADESSE